MPGMSTREPDETPTAAPFTVTDPIAPPKSPLGAPVAGAVARMAADAADTWTAPPSRLIPETWAIAVDWRALVVVVTW